MASKLEFEDPTSAEIDAIYENATPYASEEEMLAAIEELNATAEEQPVEKYNMNHDELGRFSSGSGGGGKTRSALPKESGSKKIKGASGREIDASRLDAQNPSATVADIREVSTDEADFGRRIDGLIDRYEESGINITTKRHKNEGSNGQRIAPSKMHEDDIQSLREITDPVERMKAIDSMLDFYKSRKSILYTPPRKKTNWLTDSGFVTSA